VAEESRAQIRVFDLGTRVAWQRVAAKELVKIVHAVVGVRIGWVPRVQVTGDAWKPGAMGRKIKQRDGFAAASRHPDMFGKIFGRRIVEGNFFAAHHVRQ